MQTTKKPGNRHGNTIDRGGKQTNQRRVKEKNTDLNTQALQTKTGGGQ